MRRRNRGRTCPVSLLSPKWSFTATRSFGPATVFIPLASRSRSRRAMMSSLPPSPTRSRCTGLFFLSLMRAASSPEPGRPGPQRIAGTGQHTTPRTPRRAPWPPRAGAPRAAARRPRTRSSSPRARRGPPSPPMRPAASTPRAARGTPRPPGSPRPARARCRRPRRGTRGPPPGSPRAASIATLSATGSRILPSSVTRPDLRARYPSSPSPASDSARTADGRRAVPREEKRNDQPGQARAARSSRRSGAASASLRSTRGRPAPPTARSPSPTT